MLRDELEAVLPAIDPLTGDRFQFITRDEYVPVMGPIHRVKFMRMTSFHPGGDTSRPVVYDPEYFLGLFWPVGADIACIIRWDGAEFRNVTAYLRKNRATVRTVMHVGETSTGNTVRTALYDVGTRNIEQEVRASRVEVLKTMGAKLVSETPNSHGRYEMKTTVSQRPVPKHHPHHPGTNLGRR